MSDEIFELVELLKELSEYVGLASCSGNKCRLPHCTDCNEEVDWEKLDDLRARIRTAIDEV